MLVDDLLRVSAARTPAKIALVCGGRALAYDRLQDSAARFAAGLVAAGVRRGDRVAIFLENGIEAVVAIFGSLRAGAVIVPIGASVKAAKLAHLLQDSGAAVLVTERGNHPSLSSAAIAGAPALRMVVTVCETGPSVHGRPALPMAQMLASDPLTADGRGRIDADLAALIYTSGSTGCAKGVMLTHANIVAATTSISAYLRPSCDDVILNVLPLAFDYGLYQLFLAFGAGARVVLERAFAYPGAILDLMERERVTVLPVVPTLLAILLKCDLRSAARSTRMITNTGATLPPAHIARLRAHLPHVRLYSMYGLTECKRVSYLAPEDVDARSDSVGKPMDNVEVFVADEEGRLSRSGTGELVIRGSNVMAGYWRSPEETARVLRPGRHAQERLLRSGDRFRIDADGYMYFLGRLDDVIKSRGQRVSPREVENVLYRIPGITAAAVVGVPDDLLGTAIVAVVSVSPDSGLSERSILQHCAAELEEFIVPAAVRVVSTLPTTDTGKIDRRAVQSTLLQPVHP